MAPAGGTLAVGLAPVRGLGQSVCSWSAWASGARPRRRERAVGSSWTPGLSGGKERARSAELDAETDLGAVV